MRRHPKLDGNHSEIVSALRKAGCTVQSLASVGGGCPDLLVGRMRFNTLLEVKDGSKPPSARELTEDEKEWHQTWKGHVAVVYNVMDAMRAVGLIR